MYEEPTSTEHRDIDILTDDLWQIPYIVNKKNFKINEKNVPRVKINGKLIAFDFRYPGDHYYDKKWASNMLKERIWEKSINLLKEIIQEKINKINPSEINDWKVLFS